jgi:hypothetical protein
VDITTLEPPAEIVRAAELVAAARALLRVGQYGALATVLDVLAGILALAADDSRKAG